MTHPSGVPLFKRFFRSVATIQIDKDWGRLDRPFNDGLCGDRDFPSTLTTSAKAVGPVGIR